MFFTTENVRQLALDALNRCAPDFRPLDTAEATLASFPWKKFIGSQISDQAELSRLNLELDPKGCLGRVALCFAIIEKHFPAEFERFEYGEVTVDWFWLKLMKQWKDHYDPALTPLPEGWVDELLMYEEPHGVVVGKGGYQFDPLSVLMVGQQVWHPGAFTYEPWPAITSAMFVSQSLLAQNPLEKLRLLREAESACPGTCLVKQNRVLPLTMIGCNVEAAGILRNLASVRPSARLFFVLETLFGEKHEACRKIYGDRLWSILRSRLEMEVSP